MIFIPDPKIKSRLMENATGLTKNEIDRFISLIKDEYDESLVFQMWNGYTNSRECDRMYEKIEKCIKHFLEVDEIDDYFYIA